MNVRIARMLFGLSVAAASFAAESLAQKIPSAASGDTPETRNEHRGDFVQTVKVGFSGAPEKRDVLAGIKILKLKDINHDEPLVPGADQSVGGGNHRDFTFSGKPQNFKAGSTGAGNCVAVAVWYQRGIEIRAYVAHFYVSDSPGKTLADVEFGPDAKVFIFGSNGLKESALVLEELVDALKKKGLIGKTVYVHSDSLFLNREAAPSAPPGAKPSELGPDYFQ